MKKKAKILSLIPLYILVLAVFLMIGVYGDRAITVFSQSSAEDDRTCIIIDAGHGGEDGGATSCTGILESKINLDISLKMEQIMNLIGIKTKMIRRTDRSIYTQGSTIAAKKVSDLKQRVKIVNETENAILVSIHQNYFSDDRYNGAQIFYADTGNSIELAKDLQNRIKEVLDKNNNRVVKQAKGIYLMQNIECTGILIECGFISNHEEEAKLTDNEYQKKLCCVIATEISNYLDRRSHD